MQNTISKRTLLGAILNFYIYVDTRYHCKIFENQMQMWLFDNFADLSSQVLSLMTRVDQVWQCSVCPYRSGKKDHVFYHVEAKHVESSGYECSACGYFSKTLQSYKSHVKRNHKESVFCISEL